MTPARAAAPAGGTTWGGPCGRPFFARAPAGRRRRRHAPAAVVVDLRGAEPEAGEFAQHVRLLVGQPAAPEHAAADAWKRLNIICEAFIADGHHVTIARTTYAPIEEDAE